MGFETEVNEENEAVSPWGLQEKTEGTARDGEGDSYAASELTVCAFSTGEIAAGGRVSRLARSGRLKEGIESIACDCRINVRKNSVFLSVCNRCQPPILPP